MTYSKRAQSNLMGYIPGMLLSLEQIGLAPRLNATRRLRAARRGCMSRKRHSHSWNLRGMQLLVTLKVHRLWPQKTYVELQTFCMAAAHWTLIAWTVMNDTIKYFVTHPCTCLTVNAAELCHARRTWREIANWRRLKRMKATDPDARAWIDALRRAAAEAELAANVPGAQRGVDCGPTLSCRLALTQAMGRHDASVT
jgi:hypothetical protein